MYLICKDCKKKLAGNSYYSLDELDRYYEKSIGGNNIIWGCIESSFEIALDGEKIEMPSKTHIIDNEDLKQFTVTKRNVTK
jgi:hypothetical protein